MLSNGSFLGEVGNSLIANVACNFKKPVIVFCETFKFWDKILLDSFHEGNISFGLEEVWREGKDLKDLKDLKVNRLELSYEVTSAKVLNMVVCELGYIPPTSVKVVIREYVGEEIEL